MLLRSVVSLTQREHANILGTAAHVPRQSLPQQPNVLVVVARHPQPGTAVSLHLQQDGRAAPRSIVSRHWRHGRHLQRTSSVVAAMPAHQQQHPGELVTSTGLPRRHGHAAHNDKHKALGGLGRHSSCTHRQHWHVCTLTLQFSTGMISRSAASLLKGIGWAEQMACFIHASSYCSPPPAQWQHLPRTSSVPPCVQQAGPRPAYCPACPLQHTSD